MVWETCLKVRPQKKYVFIDKINMSSHNFAQNHHADGKFETKFNLSQTIKFLITKRISINYIVSKINFYSEIFWMLLISQFFLYGKIQFENKIEIINSQKAVGKNKTLLICNHRSYEIFISSKLGLSIYFPRILNTSI